VTYRVVYLGHVARLSGAEIALSRLLPELQERVDVHVILGEDGPLVDRLREDGISVEVISMPVAVRDMRKGALHPGAFDLKSLGASGFYVRKLWLRLRELRPDLIHTNSLKAAIYGGAAGRLARIPVVWHIRDRIASDYLPEAAVRAVRLAARVLPNTVVANSHCTLDTLPRLRRGVVVPDSVDSKSVRVASTPTGITGRPFRVGMLGRLSPWKGQQIFLDAFANAFPDGDSEGWIVGSAMFGEDDYVAFLHERTRHLGIGDRVTFRGFQEDIWTELAEIDALVHCSLTPEPFGQVVIEGMAAGVPVIASGAGGPAEIVTQNVDGILVPPGDVAALAAAMRKLHDCPAVRHDLATAGRATAIRYSPERTAYELLAVYESIVSRRR
jgi:glycosyltransferase involved in cell wall biosynthesis